MDDDQPPIPSTRALLVHLIGKMESMQEEMRAHRLAFEEHKRSAERHRWLGLLGAVLEWRATIMAGGITLVDVFRNRGGK